MPLSYDRQIRDESILDTQELWGGNIIWNMDRKARICGLAMGLVG